MGKYEELKDYILMIKSDYEKYIKSLQEDISNSTFDNPDNLHDLYENADNLKYYCRELEKINRRRQALVFDEYKIRKMLEGFYPDGAGFKSLIYEDIKGIYDVGNFKYYVNGTGFETFEKAEKYSMSFGEREDWLDYAYNCL